jgi:uncharacterized RDD family membrane protein YckC
MRAMELSVLTADTLVPPGVLRAMWRGVGLVLCIIPCFLGFVPVLFDARRRGAHDMLARTVVELAETPAQRDRVSQLKTKRDRA